MIRYLSKRFAFLSSVVVGLTLPGGVFGTFITFSDGGDATQASIQGTVDAFRAAVGNANNGNAAGTVGGRREINWDGGGNVSTTAFGRRVQRLPRRRTIYNSLPGFVSSAALSSFRLNGSQPATVSAFGAVFTHVDLPNITSLQFYDLGNNLIIERFVTPGTVSNASLSFLGLVGDPNEQIARVRITSGNTPSALTFASGVDIVAMDDFIYAEPKTVPETGGIGLGLGSVLFFYRRSLAVS